MSWATYFIFEGRKQFPKGSGAAPVAAAAAADDDDVDLFGSDEEDDEAQEKIKAERVAAYTAKKSKKPALIAKTSVLLDVKPWDDETDMEKLKECVKSIQKDGLVWGADKLVPVGYGINKLQIICVVEDEKVSIDELQENITDFEEHSGKRGGASAAAENGMDMETLKRFGRWQSTTMPAKYVDLATSSRIEMSKLLQKKF